MLSPPTSDQAAPPRDIYIYQYIHTYIGAKGGKGAAAPKRDRFARACTGVGAGGVRSVSPSVRVSVSPSRSARGSGVGKPKTPSNPFEQEKADLAYF